MCLKWDWWNRVSVSMAAEAVCKQGITSSKQWVMAVNICSQSVFTSQCWGRWSGTCGPFMWQWVKEGSYLLFEERNYQVVQKKKSVIRVPKCLLQYCQQIWGHTGFNWCPFQQFSLLLLYCMGQKDLIMILLYWNLLDSKMKHLPEKEKSKRE